MGTHAILVLDAPYANDAAWRALTDCQQLLADGHTVERIFFAMEGVYIVNACHGMIHDAPNIAREFAILAETHDVPLSVCAGSAMRRGLQGERDELAPHFFVGGLIQWFGTAVASDTIYIYGQNARYHVIGDALAAKQHWWFSYRGAPYDGMRLRELYDFALAAAGMACDVVFDLGDMTKDRCDAPPPGYKNVYRMMRAAEMHDIRVHAPAMFGRVDTNGDWRHWEQR